MTLTIGTTALGAWLQDYSTAISENAAYLTDLDRQIGDADHGSNMDRGMRAVAALDPADYDSPSAYLKKVGMTLVSTVGGASGPLYGTFFIRMAGAWPEAGDAAGFGQRCALGWRESRHAGRPSWATRP